MKKMAFALIVLVGVVISTSCSNSERYTQDEIKKNAGISTQPFESDSTYEMSVKFSNAN